MAVGRDVPIAPHRPVAVRTARAPLPCAPPVRLGLPRPRRTIAASPVAVPLRAHRPYPVVRLAFRAGWRRDGRPPPPVGAPHPPGSRPTAITPAWYAHASPFPAPPRHIARGGSPPRCVAWQVARAGSFAGASPCAPHSRAGHGVCSPHPRHGRGTAPPCPAPPRPFTTMVSPVPY